MAKALSIYEQLTGVKIQDATITQLDFTKNTFIDEASIGYWKGPITIARVIEASRLYGGGTLPIPETGAIAQFPVSASGDNIIQPSGTEIWRIKAIWAVATGGSATFMLSYTDGSSIVPIKIGAVVATSGTMFDLNELSSLPITLTNSLYLQMTETAGANPANFFVAYYKMGL
jgi:hypothetical protein